ncbi:MAG: hypothetical protein IPG43_01300 [Proteobacteria bacterium]|nr:hypothetical protein [Pseudomonadota bacterium]
MTCWPSCALKPRARFYSPRTWWYCILAGMGALPRQAEEAVQDLQVHQADQMRKFCEGMLGHFPDHGQALRDMAKGQVWPREAMR